MSSKPPPKPVEPPSEEVLDAVKRRAADTRKPLSLWPLTLDQAVIMTRSAGSMRKRGGSDDDEDSDD